MAIIYVRQLKRVVQILHLFTAEKYLLMYPTLYIYVKSMNIEVNIYIIYMAVIFEYKICFPLT